MPQMTLTDHSARIDLESNAPSANKAQVDAWLKDSMAGFSHDELSAAFDLVKNAEHWKNPVDAVIDKEQRATVEAAVPFFTGTPAEFTKAPGQSDKLRVTADGYWGGPCA